MARPPAIETNRVVRLVLNVRSVDLTDDQFFRLCSDNRDFHIEMTAGGELIIMSPNNPETGRKNAKITMRLGIWAQQDGTGEVFDSSSEFTLPNGAKRAPDASWIQKNRWNRFAKEEKEKFTEICPDFVIELRSPSDRLSEVEKKMEEYITNGARLGWLLDPIDNHATIYRPGRAPERLANPTILSGDPVLPGFNFDFKEIL
ncbi:MAG: Uma2 family endonuclease [Acidobacteria bacterium]|nr:Uma2 family endonuclease [Acidobacteriota bacterium]